MNRKIGFGFIILGILIIISSFILFSKGSNDDNYLLNTSNVVGDSIDIEKYDNYSYGESFVNSYLKSHNIDKKTVVYYPVFKNSIDSDTSSEFNNNYSYDDISISAYVVDNSDVDSFIEKTINDFSDDEILKFNYSKGSFNVNDLDIMYLKVSYIFEDKFVDDFYFFVKTSGNEFAVINYFSNDKKLSDELMSRIAKEIRIEDNKATYLITSLNDGKLNGTLIGTLEKKEKPVEFKISVDASKYIEIEDRENTKNHTTFKKKDDNTIITYDLIVQYSEDIVKDLTDLMISNYKDSKELKINNLVNEKVKIDDKEFSKISFNYKDGKNDKYTNIYVEEIDENVVCIISITGSNDDSIVKDFLN